MKTLIIETDNEIRAIMHELNRLKKITEKQRTYTRNENKIKMILNTRLTAMVHAGEVITELLNRLQKLDDYDIAHGSDVEKLDS